jgi:hypothetical protein
MRTRTFGRTLGVLLAATGLVAASSTLAAAQDVDDDVDLPDGLVTCLVDGEDGFLVEPGDEVTCTAHELVAGETFEWFVEFTDLFSEEVVDEDGADDAVAGEDGTGSFTFTVPEVGPFGEYAGLVTQGEDYAEEFGGVIIDVNELDCAPDPVTAGEAVDCEAGDLEPGQEFSWAALLVSGEELFAAVEDLPEDDELPGADAEGSGVADEDGVGHYRFDVPADTAADAYLTVVEAEGYLGLYIGDIEPADEPAAPVEQPAPPAERPAATPDDDGPAPVQRPTRVDTGGGGAAGGAGDLTLVVLTAAAAAVLRRREA